MLNGTPIIWILGWWLLMFKNPLGKLKNPLGKFRNPLRLKLKRQKRGKKEKKYEERKKQIEMMIVIKEQGLFRYSKK